MKLFYQVSFCILLVLGMLLSLPLHSTLIENESNRQQAIGGAQRQQREQTPQPIASSGDNARSCILKDNRRPPLMEVRNQTDTGWCYAFTLADLLSDLSGQQVSAVSVAAASHQIWHSQARREIGRVFPSTADMMGLNSRSGTLDGGLVEDVLERVLNEPDGLCPESVAQSSVFRPDSRLERSLTELRDQAMQGGNWCPEQACQHVRNWQQIWPNLNVTDFLVIFDRVEPDVAWIEAMKRACFDHRFQLPRPAHMKAERAISAPERHRLMQNIHDAVDRGKLIGIEYNSKVLTDPYASPLDLSHLDLDSIHVSSIVGRRPNPTTGKCELLIRNSWGTDRLGKYDRSYDFENGFVWVPEESLENQLIGTIQVE